MNKSTQQTASQHDTNINVQFGPKLTVREFERRQRFTTGTNDSAQKPASISTWAPHNKQIAPTESLQNANSTKLQSNSVQNNQGLMSGTQSYTEDGARDAGSHQSTTSGALGSPTSEVTPLPPTSTATGFNDGDIVADEEAASVRMRKSVLLEATQRNSSTPQQNVSFDVMDSVDWGEVSIACVCLGKAT
jgi:hypothetical protein